MFENLQHEDVEALKAADSEFRRLYNHHRKLDSQVHDAEIGALPMDADRLNDLKREKMDAKNRLLRMWDAHRHRQVH